MVELIGLYNARLTNQFLKTLHEIERCQRHRQGEHVPPPVAADVNDSGGCGRRGRSGIRFAGHSRRRPMPEKSQQAGGQGDNAQKSDLKKRIQFYGEKSAETASVTPVQCGNP